MWLKLVLYVALSFSFLGIFQACVGLSPQNLIERNDHAGLVTYYTEEAKNFRQKAQQWDMWATYYEKHPGPDLHGGPTSDQHAVHCRAIARSYQKAADEVEALARMHRERLPEPGRD